MNKDMRIKNYTTSIPSARTQYEIEQLLISQGATMIIKNYRGDGKVEALIFKYKERGFKLPAQIDKTMALLNDIPTWSNKPRNEREDQAERISWRVIKDWIESQFALIQIGQAEFEQVMLPYMWNGSETLYDRLKQTDFMLQKGVD